MRTALIVTSLLIVAYLTLPQGHGWRGWAVLVANLAAVGGLGAAAVRARPEDRGGWRLVLVAAILWAIAAIPSVTAGTTAGNVSAVAGTWPVVGLAYGLMAVGVVRLLRASSAISNRTIWLESVVGSISFGVQWWLMSGHDTFTHGHRPSSVVVASMYSLGDLTVVIPAVAVLSARSGRDGAVRLLTLSVTADLAGDLIFAYCTGHDGTLARLGFGAMWVAQGTLLCFAGIHAARAHPDLGRHRLSAISIGALLAGTMGPFVTLAIRSAWGSPPAPSESAVAILASAAMMGLSSVRIRELVHQVQRQADALAQASRTDDLTGLANRRAGVQHLAEALLERTCGQSLMVAILDLDHFKSYNDTHGHLAGDRLLQHTGRAWADLVDGHGLLYRHGGEEFVVVVDGVDVRSVENLLDRMRAAVPDGQTFSAGITQARPSDDVDSIFARADDCLYAAKAAGRNTTVSAP